MGKEKKISSEALIKILDDHKTWLLSGGLRGKRANLKKANLDEANFEGSDFERADFEEATLIKTKFINANLKGANLRGAKLQKAHLYRANLQGADLRNAKMIKTNLKEANLLETNLSDADLEDALLNLAILRKSNLSGANLNNADLSGADLHKADLTDADLRWTNLMDANLYKSIIDSTNFNESILFRIKTDKITAAKFPEETLQRYRKTFFVESYEVQSLIVRSIEFPAKYHQAGISILNYFGTVLRKKYPDQTAKIRIDQEDLKVTMAVEPIEGDAIIIEKALDEFGLVITGQMTPEEYTDNRQLIMELKTELRVAQVRIEAQKDIIEYQRSDLTELHKLLDTGLRHPPPIQNIINLKIAPQISLIHGGLNELKEQLPIGFEEAKSVEELQQGLDQIEKGQSKEEVAKSSAMSKFRRFLENVEKAETTAGKVIKTTKDGVDIARQLAGHYNQIAQWCGLPQVPEPFVKK